MNKIYKGQLSELLAMQFLIKKHNFQIIARNYRYKKIEIDIIAYKNKIIHLMEIKYRNTPQYIQLRHQQITNLFTFSEIFYNKNYVSMDLIIINSRQEIFYYPNSIIAQA